MRTFIPTIILALLFSSAITGQSVPNAGLENWHTVDFSAKTPDL